MIFSVCEAQGKNVSEQKVYKWKQWNPVKRCKKFAQFNKFFECLHGDKTHNTVCSNKFTWCLIPEGYRFKASFHSGKLPLIGTDKNIFLCVKVIRFQPRAHKTKKHFLVRVPIHG
jgi:hypothetical protein